MAFAYFPSKFFLRKHFKLLILIVFCYLILSYFSVFQNDSPVSFKQLQLPPWASMEHNQSVVEVDYKNISNVGSGNISSLISSKSPCVLPMLDPFHPDILHIINETIKPLSCANRKSPLIFESSVEPYPKLIPVMNKSKLEELGISKCCFRRLHHRLTCINLSFETETKVPENWEFVTVECNYLGGGITGMRVVDMHTFPYQNPTKRGRDNITTTGGNSNGSRPLNVLIFGLDATSRLNFRRTMPEVHDFLMRNLSALEFMGYHKIGENTLPNIGPLLTNTKAVEYGQASRHRLSCESNNYVDDCPFIWKPFKASGYTTLYGEDVSGCHIFGTKGTKGFRSHPVDHFFEPFLISTHLISHSGTNYAARCYGPRLAFQVLINYAEKLAISTSLSSFPSPYFQFVYSASATHDHLNGARILATSLLKALQFFQRRSLLNNTLLILLSDHGTRWGEMRTHSQGYLEDKLPFLYFVVPEWFQKMYPKKYSNLKDNTRRLITVRDIYKTLVDILPRNLNNLETGSGNESGSPGISLFREILISRTCSTAHIPEHFCICNTTLNSGMAVDDIMVVNGAKAAVEYINSLLRKGDQNEGELCAKLRLNWVLRAERLGGEKKRYRLVLRVKEGNADFEAEISQGGLPEGAVKVDRVTRISKYRDQSRCIDNANLKPFCYCNNLIIN